MKWFSLCAALLLAAVALAAQPSDRGQPGAQADRVSDRMRVLQQEADRLAGEARTLLGELRRLEIERDLQVEHVRAAQAAVAGGEAAVERTTARIAALEQQRVAQLPDIEAQFVDLYKRGRGGYARLLFGAGNRRDFGRTMRAVAALVTINEQRIAEHRRTIEELQREHAALEAHLRELRTREAEARRAQTAATRAVAARAGLIEEVDSRRDLNAQLAGELQLAYERLQDRMAAGGPDELVVVPIRPFRGDLEWPAAGRVLSAFGQPSGRVGDVPRNGVEIGAAQGAPVRAVHSGTVSYAGPFTGFGTLVVLDHGGNAFSLYGYLADAAVREGAAVESGAELGSVGFAPAGPPALYFELRVDGRSVDPVQWLEPR